MAKLPSGLPDPLEHILERTIAATSLRGRERDRVLAEIRAHLEDAIGAGVPIDQIVKDFGDPELSGALIRRSPPHAPRTAAVVRATQLAAALVTVLFVSVYGATAVRFNSFARRSGAGGEWLDSIAQIAALATNTRLQLARLSVNGDVSSRVAAIARATRTASEANASDDSFGRLVSASVARDIIRAADDLLRKPRLPDDTRRAIGVQLSQIATANTRAIESAEVLTWFDHLVERSFDENGQLTATGLRLAQAMKGARQSSVTARVLEPLFFVDADDARHARLSARRVLAGRGTHGQRGDLWSRMVVGHAVDGLAAQTEVAQRLPQLIAITQR